MRAGRARLIHDSIVGAETVPVDMQVLNDTLYEVATFHDGDQFDPVDNVDFTPWRIAPIAKPAASLCAARVVRREGQYVGAVVGVH